MKSTRIPALHIFLNTGFHAWPDIFGKFYAAKSLVSARAPPWEKPDYFHANGLLTVGEEESDAKSISMNVLRIALLFPRNLSTHRGNDNL